MILCACFADQTRDLVAVLREMLAHNLEQTRNHLVLHDDASGECGESARVAVAMTHGLVESCMQVSQDGTALVEGTKAKIERIRKQIDRLDALASKAGLV